MGKIEIPRQAQSPDANAPVSPLEQAMQIHWQSLKSFKRYAEAQSPFGPTDIAMLAWLKYEQGTLRN